MKPLNHMPMNQMEPDEFATVVTPGEWCGNVVWRHPDVEEYQVFNMTGDRSLKFWDEFDDIVLDVALIPPGTTIILKVGPVPTRD